MADKDLQAKIEEARAAGYTQEEIDSFLKAPTPASNVNPQTQSQPGEAVAVNPANGNQWVDRTAEHTGLGQGIAGKALEYGAEGYLGYKGGKALLNAAGNAFRGAPAAAPVAPAVPTAPITPPTTFTGGANPAWDAEVAKPYRAPTTTGNPNVPAAQRIEQIRAMRAAPPTPAAPPTAPVTPATGGPAAAEGSTFLERMATKFAPMARTYGPALARAGVGISAATYSPSLGPTLPKGVTSEINPSTGRPWTAQEIATWNQTH